MYLVKSSLSILRKQQFASLNCILVVRGELLRRANLPNSSPSCSVHITSLYYTNMILYIHSKEIRNIYTHCYTLDPIITLTDPLNIIYHDVLGSPSLNTERERERGVNDKGVWSYLTVFSRHWVVL